MVSVTPAQLDWGGCPVLTPVPKGLVLRNESEIEATFETVFVSNLFKMIVTYQLEHS